MGITKLSKTHQQWTAKKYSWAELLLNYFSKKKAGRTFTFVISPDAIEFIDSICEHKNIFMDLWVPRVIF